MRPAFGVLALSTMLAALAIPAWAQDEEEAAPADEAPAAAAPDDDAAAQAVEARRARIRARRAARRQAILQQRAEAAAQAEAAARTEAAAPAAAPAQAPAPAKPAAAIGTPPDTMGVDTAAAGDTLRATGPAAAAASEIHETHAGTHAADHHPAPLAHGEAAAEHVAEGGVGAGEHARFSIKTFVLQLINFAVLLFILIRYGGRVLSQALRAKHEQLKTEIGEATRLRDEALQKAAAQARRLGQLEKEIAVLLENMRKEADQEQARLVEAAQQRGQQIQEEMRTQIVEQVKIAEAALRAEVANASVALAEEIARKSVSFEDERRLAREFVAGFAGSEPTRGATR